MSAPVLDLPVRGVRGVLVDLDDTLYPQAEFLSLAWRAVAERGARYGLDPDALVAALGADAAHGSARGGVIDRAVARIGGSPTHVPALLTAFRAVHPSRLTPYPGVAAALAELRGYVPLALVTDGEVAGQRRKLAALGLDGMFDIVVFSDRWGRERRKPHPRPFQEALRGLGVGPAEAVMIGDRPDKDVAGAAAVGMRAIRVGTGEYSARPDHPDTWARLDSFAAAVAHLLAYLPAAPVTASPFPRRRAAADA